MAEIKLVALPPVITDSHGYVLIEREDGADLIDQTSQRWWSYPSVRSARCNAAVMRRHATTSKSVEESADSQRGMIQLALRQVQSSAAVH